MQLRHAEEYLQLAVNALAAGDPTEAPNQARRAYAAATKALKKLP